MPGVPALGVDDLAAITSTLQSGTHGNAAINTKVTKPAADSTANATVADVIGSKDDAAQTTVATTRSLVAYMKGAITWLAVPSNDYTGNFRIGDVVGSKADAASLTVGTTKSLMAYVKGVVNALSALVGANYSGLTETSEVVPVAATSPASINTYGSYVQIHGTGNGQEYVDAIVVTNTAASALAYYVRLATGGAGSETDVLGRCTGTLAAGASTRIPLKIPLSVSAATRLSVKIANVTNGTAGSADVTVDRRGG